MAHKPSGKDHKRIDDAIEGRLSESELREFMSAVREDPILREAYVERAWIHSVMVSAGQRLPSLFRSVVAMPRRFRRKLTAGLGILLGGACFGIGFGLRASIEPRFKEIPFAATLLHTQNTKWANSTLPTAENARLGPGTLALVEGVASIRFGKGATVTLEAPATLEVVNDNHCRLTKGMVTALIPGAARGFTIDTVDTRVTSNVYSKVGVVTDMAGVSTIFVFEGKTSVFRNASGDARELDEGSVFNPQTNAVAANVEAIRGEGRSAALDGWTAIPTSYGKGRDGYVRRGRPKDSGASPLLFVKHSELPGAARNERRAYLGFDLSAVLEARSINEAELILLPEPSGFGFHTMVPEESRFAVYGVTDETLDAWREDNLTWDNAPAVLSGDLLDPSKTRKLAEFTLHRGAFGEPIFIGGRDLAEFIRSKLNQVATLIIVRESGETHPSGVIHAFASKEHPAARPPTLRVR